MLDMFAIHMLYDIYLSVILSMIYLFHVHHVFCYESLYQGMNGECDNERSADE